MQSMEVEGAGSASWPVAVAPITSSPGAPPRRTRIWECLVAYRMLLLGGGVAGAFFFLGFFIGRIAARPGPSDVTSVERELSALYRHPEITGAAATVDGEYQLAADPYMINNGRMNFQDRTFGIEIELAIPQNAKVLGKDGGGDDKKERLRVYRVLTEALMEQTQETVTPSFAKIMDDADYSKTWWLIPDISLACWTKDGKFLGADKGPDGTKRGHTCWTFEVVSPILTRKDNGIERVRKMFEALESIGALATSPSGRMNPSLGFHIHIGQQDIYPTRRPACPRPPDSDKGKDLRAAGGACPAWQFPADMRMWVTTYLLFEDALLQLLQEERRDNDAELIASNRHGKYAMHLDDLSDPALIAAVGSAQADLRELVSTPEKGRDINHLTARWKKLNLHSLDRHRTAEFRAAAATVSAKEVVNWIDLHMALVHTFEVPHAQLYWPGVGSPRPWGVEDRLEDKLSWFLKHFINPLVGGEHLEFYYRLGVGKANPECWRLNPKDQDAAEDCERRRAGKAGHRLAANFSSPAVFG
mmetsp:Transcript_122026/g.304521  ORF Transcript_122026/g.304521 Transcript_122026/m.304521 type:complete len:530 (+) Transcript_122026:49-1638(+)